ncbi:MAG: TetR family transcriptional regulator [Gemmatimonadota bacterium]|nr:TetR family transcriptional regulator [Gemmatimonadota bacterium]
MANPKTMAAPSSRERSRDADRSRESILDAAEQLFADRGYEATSLTEIGMEAGVSRATPGYFFGSKAELYEAVLDRSFADVRAAVRSGRQRAQSGVHAPEAVLAGALRDYHDFLSARPNFVRLMEREALGHSPSGADVSPRLAAGQEALSAISEELGLAAADSDEAAHLLLSIVALCWFPIVHGSTLLRSIGLDPKAPGFAATRKKHIVDLVLHGVAHRLRRPGHAAN